MQQDYEQHQMELESTYPSGAEVWHCPKCGRRFIVEWRPAFNVIVMQAGDVRAVHTGCRQGIGENESTALVRFDQPCDQVADDASTQKEFEPAQKMELWEELLKDVDLDV